MEKQQKAFGRALVFVRKKHRGQFRAGGMPVWHHLLRVSELLGRTLDETKEGSPVERFAIPLSALGHDLMEDTSAQESEIASVFGERGLELIRGMTNTLGDKNHTPYIRSVTRSEEAVRLIKLSDLYDNFTSVLYNLSLLGTKWTTSYFLPITVPMYRSIRKTRFVKYKKTADHLVRIVGGSLHLLQRELAFHKKFGRR